MSANINIFAKTVELHIMKNNNALIQVYMSTKFEPRRVIQIIRKFVKYQITLYRYKSNYTYIAHSGLNSRK